VRTTRLKLLAKSFGPKDQNFSPSLLPEPEVASFKLVYWLEAYKKDVVLG
jgi:hypothetical protein